jgi:carbohydrate kinase (thermoresistant glucokinase family)
MTNTLIVMGISGTGKSTLGRALAKKLSWGFIEGDDYHPQVNIEKMRNGTPLTDDDRWPWLDAMHQAIAEKQQHNQPVVVTCSALKKSYRERLVQSLSDIEFIYLCGDPEMILERMTRRKNHFMPAGLLDSQIAAMEPPGDAIFIPIDLTTEAQVDAAVKQLHSGDTDETIQG